MEPAKGKFQAALLSTYPCPLPRKQLTNIMNDLGKLAPVTMQLTTMSQPSKLEILHVACHRPGLNLQTSHTFMYLVSYLKLSSCIDIYRSVIDKTWQAMQVSTNANANFSSQLLYIEMLFEATIYQPAVARR